jgi:formylglycine-generating enzyme required for sulfatase activity
MSSVAFDDQSFRVADYAWHQANSEKRTHEVGRLRSNPFGLHDLHGNVWEWCRDLYAAVPKGGTDPENAADGPDRVLRGGGRDWDGQGTSSGLRGNSRPDQLNYDFGFRVALIPSGDDAASPTPPFAVTPFDADRAK